MKIINLYGGPSTGKSRTAARLFADMKDMGLKVELVREWIKDHMYNGRTDAFPLQEYIFAKQRKSQHYLQDNVDWVVTDSPLLLSNIYAPRDELFYYFEAYVRGRYNEYDNVNIFLRRNPEVPYANYGRTQTEDQAKDIDNQIWKYFVDYNVNFEEVQMSEHTCEDILKVIGL